MVPTAFLGHPASTELCTLTEVIMLRIYMYTLYKKKNNDGKFKIFINSKINLMNYTINRCSH